MTTRDRRLLFGLAALALAIPGLIVLGVHSDALLALPVALFALPLLAGRYVGEERLARLAARARPVRARRAPVARLVLPLRRHGSMPRGGCLVGMSLAVRPPPELATALR